MPAAKVQVNANPAMTVIQYEGCRPDDPLHVVAPGSLAQCLLFVGLQPLSAEFLPSALHYRPAQRASVLRISHTFPYQLAH